MHNNKFFQVLVQILNQISMFLPAIFWLLLIYGFNDPCTASTTVIAAIIHECGHGLCILVLNTKKAQFRSSISGFRIKRSALSSYKQDLLLYAAGPMANFLVVIAVLPIYSISPDFFSLFFAVNLATGISNLLPVDGYDGYGILHSFINVKFQNQSTAQTMKKLLDSVSFFFTALITLFSLYVMARVGDGYWLSGLFMISLIKEASKRLKPSK